MQRDSSERGLDSDLAERLGDIPLSGQRWLKMALVMIPDLADTPAKEVPPPPPKPRRIEKPKKGRKPVDLEEVISGRAKLEDQLEEYPELQEELEGLGDVIDLLREAGKARRRKGEDVLRELGLGSDGGAEAEEELEE
jgi:hypothetical protein